MKSNIINKFVVALGNSIKADLNLDAAFASLLKEHGIKVSYHKKTGDIITTKTEKQVKAVHAEIGAALDKVYGEAKEGARKTAANKVSMLAFRYDVMLGNRAGAKRSKYSPKQFAKVFVWLKKSFNLDDAELAGFLVAAAKAARKAAK